MREDYLSKGNVHATLHRMAGLVQSESGRKNQASGISERAEF